MTMPPVIFLNGPPRCGKDTLAKHIAETLPGFKVFKFAEILKERTHALYGGYGLPHNHFEETKDTVSDFFLGLTPRQAYIHVSETLMKPVHGDQVFGRLLLAKMLGQSSSVKAFLISDSGFAPEAIPVINHFGADSCVLVRIHAEKRGCSFRNDSRSHITLPVTTFDIHNDASQGMFLAQCDQNLNRVLQQMVGGQ